MQARDDGSQDFLEYMAAQTGFPRRNASRELRADRGFIRPPRRGRINVHKL